MSNATDFIKQNVGTIAITTGGTLLGGVVGYALGKRTSKKKKKSMYRNRKKSRRYSYKKRKGKRYTPHTAGKRKDSSHRRIRYTKRGQPYVILSSGKARFIKSSSARIRHKRKGGFY